MKPIVKNSILSLLAVLFFGTTIILSVLPEEDKWMPTSALIGLIILIITVASMGGGKKFYNTLINTSVFIVIISATLAIMYSVYLSFTIYTS